MGLEFESPAGHQKTEGYIRAPLFFYPWRFEPSKCNSPVDCCRRRLGGGDPLFLPVSRKGKNANESPAGHKMHRGVHRQSRIGPWTILIFTYDTLVRKLLLKTTKHVITFLTATFNCRIGAIARTIQPLLPGNQNRPGYILDQIHSSFLLSRLFHYITY